MTERLDKVSERNAIATGARASCRLTKRPILPAAGSPVVRGPLMKAVMVIGYLGLVVTLSMAPFWHQVTTPSMADPAIGSFPACTDFGGSR